MRDLLAVVVLLALLGGCVTDGHGGRFDGAYGGVSGAAAKSDP